MPPSPYVICLGDAGRAELESVSRRATAPHRAVLRARIVLLAATGTGNSDIARRLEVCEDTARKWRRRYRQRGPAGLAAYDVHQARVMGRCEPATGIKPFTALIDQVMTSEPYASARRAFWVVDNGASHRNRAAADRLSSAYPNAQMVHLPVHASWLNQVEVYFSVIQRKLLTPDDFGDPVLQPQIVT